MSTSNRDRNSVRASINSRLEIEYLLNKQTSATDNGKDIIFGLTKQPKMIPPHYFYDRQGSQLFEDICQLPEYYPTRTEQGILEQNAVDIAQITQARELVELGSGSSTKTRLLLSAYQELITPLYYVPIDVSSSILKDSAYSLLTEYPQLKIQGKVATYSQALQQIKTYSLGTKMIIFLGSSIGNFDRSECDRFIAEITDTLRVGEYFLLGLDLQKAPEILEAAYNDSQGVTAAFNLNMLQHLNQLFAGDFNLDLFQHQALYNQTDKQIEMYLISQEAQTVNLKTLDLTVHFAEGEAILTEISRKFNLEQMSAYLKEQGLTLVKSYTDTQAWFGLLLCQKL